MVLPASASVHILSCNEPQLAICNRKPHGPKNLPLGVDIIRVSPKMLHREVLAPANLLKGLRCVPKCCPASFKFPF